MPQWRIEMEEEMEGGMMEVVGVDWTSLVHSSIHQLPDLHSIHDLTMNTF